MTERDPLLCLLAGQPVAEVIDAGDGLCAIRYLPGVAAEQPGARLLSVRLPVRDETYPAMAGPMRFLDGVLPEDWVRDRYAEAARIPSKDTFGLLARYGRDCAGAIAFVAPGDEPEPSDVRWLTDAELVDIVNNLQARPLGAGTSGVRLSLGGVQEKLVVVHDDGHYGLPVGDQPSTHILKPTPLKPDGSERWPGLAEIEHLCVTVARLAGERFGDRVAGIGFTAPRTSLVHIGDRSGILIERYDRRPLDNGNIERIHQEDGCQVLGLEPSEKYQRGDGPPSLRAFAEAIAEFGSDALLDQRALLQHVTYSMCVANADLHAKNLSLVHDDGVRLAPLYDVVATSMYTDVDAELGLKVGGEYHLDDVSRGSLIDEAGRWALGAGAAGRAIDAVLDAVDALIDDVASDLGAGGAAAHRLEEAAATIRQRAGLLRG